MLDPIEHLMFGQRSVECNSCIELRWIPLNCTPKAQRNRVASRRSRMPHVTAIRPKDDVKSDPTSSHRRRIAWIAPKGANASCREASQPHVACDECHVQIQNFKFLQVRPNIIKIIADKLQLPRQHVIEIPNWWPEYAQMLRFRPEIWC